MFDFEPSSDVPPSRDSARSDLLSEVRVSAADGRIAFKLAYIDILIPAEQRNLHSQSLGCLSHAVTPSLWKRINI